MAVTPEEVRRVAALARLELVEAEIEELVRDLSEILGHVGALEGVEGPDGRDRGRDRDRDRGDPDLSGGDSRLRGDDEGSDPLAESPASFAPDFEGGYFTVPRLESHEDRGAE